jgi:hypothetical protein
VGTVKSVSAEAIRLLLSVLGFLTFGYGSKEFEVTAERLGCYRPEDHIGKHTSYLSILHGECNGIMAVPATHEVPLPNSPWVLWAWLRTAEKWLAKSSR